MDERTKTYYELVEKRRSVREFLDTPVPLDVLSRLLMTLNRAQSAANRQPWHFIVVETKAGETNRDELNGIFTKEGFKNAPVLIVACADKSQGWVRKNDGTNFAWVDVAIALTEMIGAATAEGLGTCWIASLDAERAKAILGIPSGVDLVAIIAIGYPADGLKKEDKPRKPIQEIIHYGRW